MDARVAAWALLLALPSAAAGSEPRASVNASAWSWQASPYLGHWQGRTRWPELARCWQRYGGDATTVAAAPPAGHAARTIEVSAFPRHADFDRRKQKARTKGPYPEQEAALALIERDGATLAERVLDAVHGYFLDHDLDAVADEVWNDDGRRNLERMKTREAVGETVALARIHVHNKWRDGLSYVGLIFETGWDDGHGLGVLVHGTRVVAVGGADTAFNPSQWADGELEEPRQPWLH
jgi:hypothetical protein